METDSDNEGELPPLDGSQRLSWRMDPESSHSDWTIEVLVQDGGKRKRDEGSKEQSSFTYHVHRNILSVGAKKSQYFAALFLSKMNSQEARTQTSRIPLVKPAADAFPVFLDYLYTADDNLSINHGNAAALHHLGHYFEVARLRKKVCMFWTMELDLKHCGMYYDQSKVFSDEKLVRFIFKKCCECFDKYKWNINTESSFDSHLWIEILKHNNGKPNSILSEHVAAFCFKNRDTMNSETFLQLTDEKLLTVILPQDALQWMEVERAVLPENGVQKLSVLQERCIKELISSGYCASLEGPGVLEGKISQFPPLVLSKMFAKLSKQSSNDRKQLEKKLAQAAEREKKAGSLLDICTDQLKHLCERLENNHR